METKNDKAKKEQKTMPKIKVTKNELTLFMAGFLFRKK